jgi:SAM-dependent methyltransferase
MEPERVREPEVGVEAKPPARPTRGSGLLEPFLARMRARKANSLIPSHLRSGRILDVGCGSYPYFLAHTEFAEKFALDQAERPVTTPSGVQWHSLDLHRVEHFPFPDSHFHVVTMLAVIEHLDPERLVGLLREVRRTLVPGGVLVITTPAPWSDSLLHTMARIGLVSAEEIEEHQFPYNLPLIGWYFGAAGFDMRKLRFGYFEAWLNLWAVAER